MHRHDRHRSCKRETPGSSEAACRQAPRAQGGVTLPLTACDEWPTRRAAWRSEHHPQALEMKRAVVGPLEGRDPDDA